MNKCPIDKQKSIVVNIITGVATGKITSISDVEDIIRSYVPDLTLDESLSTFDEVYRSKLVNILEKNFGFISQKEIIDEGGEKVEKYVMSIKRTHNLVGDFRSSEVSDLFHTLSIQYQYFGGRVNHMFGTALFLGEKSASTFVQSNAELNSSIKDLKNNLFKIMVDHLILLGKLNKSKFYKEEIFIKDLYSRTGILDTSVYNDYKEVVKLLQLEFFDQSETANTFSGKKVPKLRDMHKHSNQSDIESLWDVFNATVIMVNFDDVLDKYFGSSVKIDYNAYNHLEEGIDKLKYKRNTTGATTAYFKEDGHESESVDSIADEFSTRLVSIIPALNKDGAITKDFLEMKDLYGLSSFIKTFELQNFSTLSSGKHTILEKNKWRSYSSSPGEAIDWYIDLLIQAENKNYDGEYEMFKDFKSKIWLVKSLQSFFNDIKVKEINSDKLSIKNIITQVLNNSFGATYSYYNPVKNKMDYLEMHSHNADRVNAQNSMYSHLSAHATNPLKFSAYYAENKSGKQEVKTKSIPSSIEELNRELQIINNTVTSPEALVRFIYEKIGLYIGVDAGSYLYNKWNTQEKNVIGNNLQIILEAIRKKENNKKNVLESIIENEQAIEDKEFDLAAEKSEIIQAVTKTATMQTILDSYLYNYNAKPITTVNTLTGEAIPTFKVANLTYNDVELLLSRKNIESIETAKGIDEYKNYFTNNDALLGTVTKLETRNRNINKSAFSWSVLENFTANFEYDFLSIFGKDSSQHEGINVMIGNYSEKNTILSKLISSNAMFNGKFIIGNKYATTEPPKKTKSKTDPNAEFRSKEELSETKEQKAQREKIESLQQTKVMNTNEIKENIRTQALSYYSGLLRSVFTDFTKLGVILEAEDYGNGPIIDTSNKKTMAKNIAAINEFLGKFKINKNSDGLSDFLELVRNKRISDSTINIVNELHFSTYSIPGTEHKEQRLALNQVILDYFDIYGSTTNFNKFVKSQEDSLIRKLEKEIGENVLFTSNRLDKLETDGNLDYIRDSLNISKEESKKFKKEGKELIYIGTNENKTLNPLLQKWLWVNTFFREEYLNMSFKGEYMHPVKKVEYRGDKDFNLEAYNSESSKRMIIMAKRNVVFTSTFELPIRNSKYGVPEELNIAVIKDATDRLYNLSGKVHNQDLHDGSSVISYLFSKMVEASYPGKGYNGTKKQFGTFISAYGSAIKKDAETVLTNSKIRESLYSPIKFKDKQRQSLGIDITDLNVRIKRNFKISYIKNGTKHSSHGYTLTPNEEGLLLSYNEIIGKSIFARNIQVKNLYDIWEAFGGEFSIGEDGNFNEDSNELLVDLISNFTNEDDSKNKYPLKNKMIHIISNYSSFKSGSTNLNAAKHWETGEQLGYFTAENRFYGPQLDANHNADSSEIREITQVISALAQNENTSGIANEVYNDIARIIHVQMNKYKRYMKDLDPIKLKQLSKFLSKRFFNQIQRSDNVSLAKTLLESFEQGDLIPFSNQNFFQQFVRDMVTAMNNEFISRHYSGIGAVLNPSHQIVQLFEDKDGNVQTQNDIAKKALAEYAQVGEDAKTNESIIQDYITNNFQDIDTFYGDIEPEDTVKVFDLQGNFLEEAYLNDIAEYYKFKARYKNQPVKFLKVLTAPRDLRPTRKLFKVNGVKHNLFDLDSVRLTFLVNNLNTLNKDDEDYKIMINFAKFFNIDSKDVDGIKKKLIAWTARNMQFIESKKIMPPVTSETIFKDYFNGDTFTYSFNDVKNSYNNLLDISDYVFYDAEMMLPNIYKSTFKVGKNSIAEINLQKEEFFKERITPDFQNIDPNYDLKITLKEGNNPIYVKFTDSVIRTPIDSRIKKSDEIDNQVGKLLKYRMGENNEPLYYLPNEASVQFENDKEIIYIPITSSNNQDVFLKKTANVNIKQFINSFHGEISTIVPILNSKLEFKKGDGISNANEISYDIFQKFTKYNGKYDGKDENWLQKNKEDILDHLANRMYVSWQKSHEFVVARIPSQSMQSFMPMKNVSYFNTESNDVYVSVWQIFLQGSDFDIDKAYVLGYGFDNSGQFEDWSNISSYRTKEQLDVLEEFPIPNGSMTTLVPSMTDKSVDITEEFTKLDLIWEDLNSGILQKETLVLLNDILRKIGESGEITATVLNPERVQELLDAINKHNLDNSYINRKNSVKNSIVGKIRKIISAPSNQLLAEEPVDIQMHHDGAAAATEIYGYDEDLLSRFDMVSMFKQQEDASVGKQDVGIGANGLKVLFNLDNYYNAYYKSKGYRSEYTRTSPYATSKELYMGKNIKPKKGETFKIHTISGTEFSKEFEQKILDSYGYTGLKQDLEILDGIAALNISGFLSGATDNAKELVMAKINAVVDLARMHLYLMSVGFSATEVAVYMNSPLARWIAGNLKTNSFGEKPEKKGVSLLIDKYEAEIKNNKEKVTPEVYEEEIKSIASFRDIYNGASEFSGLASILKVNQRTSANMIELNNLFNKLEGLMYRGENSVFGKKLGNIRNYGNSVTNTYDKLSKEDKFVVNMIIKSNKNFQTPKDKLTEILKQSNSELNSEQSFIRQYIINTLLAAKNIEVIHVGKFGVEEKREVSILGGQFDFRYYINDKNEKYREATINYYNLFKNTINVFHVLENSPHFKAMLDGVALTHEILNFTSKKYNYIFSEFKDIVRNNSVQLASKNSNEIKHIYGNESLPVKIEDRHISKALVDFDKRAISKWLKSGKQAGDLTFNVGKLLEQTNIPEFRAYTNDLAKQNTVGQFMAKKLSQEIENRMTVVNPGDDFIVDLTTDFGIANFKMLMENVLYNLLGRSKKSSISRNLLLSPVKTSNNMFSNQISPSFPINKLNSPVNANKFRELIDSFSNIDNDIESYLKVNNSRGKTLRWTDLLYTYNLIINNEQYGNKRLTPLFENYAKDKDTFAYEYMDFSRKIDSGEQNILDTYDMNNYSEENTEESINQSKEYAQTLINSILFSAFNKGNSLSTINKSKKMMLLNANFPINTSMDIISGANLEKYQNISTIISLIKSNGLIINFKCK